VRGIRHACGSWTKSKRHTIDVSSLRAVFSVIPHDARGDQRKNGTQHGTPAIRNGPRSGHARVPHTVVDGLRSTIPVVGRPPSMPMMSTADVFRSLSDV
jgi:hypothetical protein